MTLYIYDTDYLIILLWGGYVELYISSGDLSVNCSFTVKNSVLIKHVNSRTWKTQQAVLQIVFKTV
jgi:hypothetical protein